MSKLFDENYVRIGLILKPRGIRGEIKVLPLTDDPARFMGLKEAFLEQEGIHRECRLQVNRASAAEVHLYVAGTVSVEAAQKLRGAYICVRREDAIPLPTGTWFIKDLIGMQVSIDGAPAGELREVLPTGGVDVYRVRLCTGSTMMFPALRRVIDTVDVAKKHMNLLGEPLAEVRVDED